ncbi:MAG: DUF6873 family GME fold protein [Eubacteriales bacterium]
MKCDFELIKLPPDPALSVGVCSHTDLLIFILEDSLIARRSYYKIAKSELDFICRNSDLKLILSDDEAGEKYPNDCGLCAAISGKNIVCRKKSTDRTLLRVAEEKGYSVVNVAQGYAKCSSAVLPDGALITADVGIARAAPDSLLIREGYIDLPGYGYGFIGGASGSFGNTLYFCGRIEDHPDYIAIKDFADRHGAELCSLGNHKLFDVGTLFFV